jgi:molybdenum cofactor cytidylyltransferase
MKLGLVPLDNALGTILVHNIIGVDGRKVLSKGHIIRAEDIETLHAIGKETIYVAMLDADDVREDDAAVLLARAAAGDNIEASKPSGGRVNLYATQRGVLRVNRDALKRINELQGATLATIPGYSVVAPKKMIATIKTVGLALPQATIRAAEEIGAVLSVAPITIERVGIILTGSANGKTKTQSTFSPPIRARIEEIGTRVIAESFTDENADAINVTIMTMLGAGAQMIIIAGETSIMDANDITPRGIQDAGGVTELYGAPVEPGNLLLLAYIGNVPIIAAPGCIKSRETNVVDLILPRLMIGDHVTRADVIDLAEGGLLPQPLN